jgi:hypothetical protein
VAGYLWATGYLPCATPEAYAPLHHQDQKHFLRLHIDTDGGLTIYPIAIERCGRKWTLRPDASASAPWFDAVGQDPAAAPHRAADPDRGAHAGLPCRARPPLRQPERRRYPRQRGRSIVQPSSTAGGS